MNRSALRLGKWLVGMVFSRENMFALLLAVIIIMVYIVTADSAPQWIYQGF